MFLVSMFVVSKTLLVLAIIYIEKDDCINILKVVCMCCVIKVHLSFYLDRDSSYKADELKDDSSFSVFGSVLNAFTQFAILIGRTKDAELQ